MPESLTSVLRLEGVGPAGLDDRRGDRIMAAARAQRRVGAFVVAPRQPERVLRQVRMRDLRFGHEGHDAHQLRRRRRDSVLHRGHDAVEDVARRDRHAVVMQDRAQAALVHAGLQRQQRAQLRVAILLDDEIELMRLEKLLDFLAERKAAHAHVVDLDALSRQAQLRLAHRRRRRCRARRSPISVLLAASRSPPSAPGARRSATSCAADRPPPGTPSNPRCRRRTGCGPNRARNRRPSS